MRSIGTDTTVVAKDSHVATTVDGETVLLNDETGAYQGLAGVGSRIWELVQEPTTVGDVVETITAEYDVDEGRCERDVRGFVGELAAERLVEVDDRPAE